MLCLLSLQANADVRLPIPPPERMVALEDQPGVWRPADAKKPQFWVVNFGTARTLAKGRVGFAAGIGGQVVLVGDPRWASAFVDWALVVGLGGAHVLIEERT